MNRQQRTKLFFELYIKEITENPETKRYVCYLRAESAMEAQTGKRQYNKYDTFRAAISRASKDRDSFRAEMSIANKKRKEVKRLLADITKVCKRYNMPFQILKTTEVGDTATVTFDYSITE